MIKILLEFDLPKSEELSLLDDFGRHNIPYSDIRKVEVVDIPPKPQTVYVVGYSDRSDGFAPIAAFALEHDAENYVSYKESQASELKKGGFSYEGVELFSSLDDCYKKEKLDEEAKIRNAALNKLTAKEKELLGL